MYIYIYKYIYIYIYIYIDSLPGPISKLRWWANSTPLPLVRGQFRGHIRYYEGWNFNWKFKLVISLHPFPKRGQFKEILFLLFLHVPISNFCPPYFVMCAGHMRKYNGWNLFFPPFIFSNMQIWVLVFPHMTPSSCLLICPPLLQNDSVFFFTPSQEYGHGGRVSS